MFDKSKFDKIAKATEQLLNYGDNKEAQEMIHHNLLLLTDMLFDEFERGINKEKYRGYIKIADELYRNITER